jgi:hypothetical protein
MCENEDTFICTSHMDKEELYDEIHLHRDKLDFTWQSDEGDSFLHSMLIMFLRNPDEFEKKDIYEFFNTVFSFPNFQKNKQCLKIQDKNGLTAEDLLRKNALNLVEIADILAIQGDTEPRKNFKVILKDSQRMKNQRLSEKSLAHVSNNYLSQFY